MKFLYYYVVMEKQFLRKPSAMIRFILLLILALALTGCPNGSDLDCQQGCTCNICEPGFPTYIQRVIFTENTAIVTFDNLINNDIFLVKVNTSNFVVPAANTGHVLNVASAMQDFQTLNALESNEKEVQYTRGHPLIQKFNADPPPFNSAKRRGLTTCFVPPQVGDTRYFWVETFFTSGSWEQRRATLMATGEHSNIWVMDYNSREVTLERAQQLASQFDLIYPLTTNIFGYEFGGGLGGNGGMDGDPKIQILVYDILNAAGQFAANGFFWAKDFFTQEELNASGWNVKTNLAEIFYINSITVIDNPAFSYSVLIHELQHMIHWNEKTVIRGVNSAAWYNEMLSLMAEDIIAPMIGVPTTDRGHPLQNDLPWFLLSYFEEGFTEWHQTAVSYATKYAFGAFLLRNFGGADLARRIIQNNTTNIPSLTAALQETSGVTFEQALRHFGEAMVFSGAAMPQGVKTFDRTYTSTVNGISYTAYGFDIWNMYRRNTTTKGPMVFDVSPRAMRPHSVLLHQDDTWRNRSGSISITMERPVNQSVEFYLMVREGVF